MYQPTFAGTCSGREGKYIICLVLQLAPDLSFIRLCAGISDKDLNEDNPAASDDSVFRATDFAADL